MGGSTYIIARPAVSRPEVKVFPRIILLGYRTKKIRYWFIGKPYLWFRSIAKRLYRLYKPS
jgi:hypothetical protein